MNFTISVGRFEGLANLFRKPDRLFRIQPAARMQEVAKCLSLHEVHGDELQSTSFTDVIDPDDIFVSDFAGQQ